MNTHMFRGRVRPHVWGGIAFALLAAAYCFITPPFRGPDERNHFLRAYHVSELRIFANRLPNGMTGDQLPVSLVKMAAAVGPHADNRMTDAQLAAARAIQLAPENRGAAEFPNTALYSPVAYLPAAAAIGLGAALDMRPLHLLYLGRIANVIAASCLISFALAQLGYARWPAVLAAALPMAVSQMALVTADAMTFAFSFAWIALVAHMAVADTALVARKTVVRLVLLALVLSQLRPPYPVLAMLVLAINPQRLGGWKAATPAYAAVIVAATIPALAWTTSVKSMFVPEPGHDVAARISLLQERPTAFLREVRNDITRRGTLRWSQIVGRFGWLNIKLPGAFTSAYAAALAASCFLAAPYLPRPRRYQRLVFLGTAVVGVVGIQLSLFITYNVGWSQGRYFIPFVIALAFAAGGMVIVQQRARTVLAIATALVFLSTHAAALYAIAEAQR